MESGMIYRLFAKLRNLRYHYRTAKFDTLKTYKSKLGGGYLQYIMCSWLYGASFEDYYELGFYRMSAQQRHRWITTSLRHEFTRQLNSETDALELRDKKLFIKKFSCILGHATWTSDDLESTPELTQPGNLVIKHRFGQAGSQIYFPETFSNQAQLRTYLDLLPGNHEDYVLEELILQHKEMARLNPDAVNTLRIVTLLKDDTVKIFAVLLRMSVGKKMDNFAAGGIVACVEENGIVKKDAVYKDPLTPSVSIHPLSGESILGFSVPYYHEAVELAKQAARMIPTVRSIGWDIAIGQHGPLLIEGNDNWGKTVLQLPLGKGMRHLAESTCNMSLVYR